MDKVMRLVKQFIVKFITFFINITKAIMRPEITDSKMNQSGQMVINLVLKP